MVVSPLRPRRFVAHSIALVALFCVLVSCQQKITLPALTTKITSRLEKQRGSFAVAFRNLSTGEELLIHEHDLFHAASTMKVPVMIEVFRQVAAGTRRLTDSILIRNEFRSLVDGSPYSLQANDDSELSLYTVVGQKRPLDELVYKMITASSNLATNILIEEVGATAVTKTMRDLGAHDIQVLRGVEDGKAYARGLNNQVTAYDLMILLAGLSQGSVVNAQASGAMIAIMLDQKFNTIVPAQLPAGTKVAHKTGWFKGTNHDAAIVYPANGKNYVVVLLSSGIKKEKKEIRSMAKISRWMYAYVSRESR
jgi:beta-lactamase class A